MNVLAWGTTPARAWNVQNARDLEQQHRREQPYPVLAGKLAVFYAARLRSREAAGVELFPPGLLTLCLSCRTASKGRSASARPGLAFSPVPSPGVRLEHPPPCLT